MIYVMPLITALIVTHLSAHGHVDEIINMHTFHPDATDNRFSSRGAGEGERGFGWTQITQHNPT